MKNNTKFHINYTTTITAKDAEGKLHKIKIEGDECPESPREWDNVATMIAFWDRCTIGDKTDYKNGDEAIHSLVRKYCTVKEVADSVRSGKFETIRIIPDPEDPGHVIIQEYVQYRTPFNKGNPVWEDTYTVVDSDEHIYEFVVDDLTIEMCQQLLEPHLEMLPLSIYEHGGMTIYIGAPCDRWDSGYAGFIYVDKETAFQELCHIEKDENGNRIFEEYKHENAPSTFGVKSSPITEDNWREAARDYMKGEVEVYDAYIRGDVYGYTLYDIEHHESEHNHLVKMDNTTGEILVNNEWDDEPYDDEVETDSCWGFYGPDHEENGLLDEFPNDWEIVSVED